MRFFYKAVDAAGTVRSGYRTGENRESILRLLKDEGLYPLEVKVARGKSFSFRRRVGKKDLLAFTQQLSGLLDSGVQLSKAMEIITRLLEKSAIGPVVLDIHRLVQEGASFSRALETHKEVFVPSISTWSGRGKTAACLRRSWINWPALWKMKLS